MSVMHRGLGYRERQRPICKTWNNSDGPTILFLLVADDCGIFRFALFRAERRRIPASTGVRKCVESIGDEGRRTRTGTHVGGRFYLHRRGR